VEAIRDAGIGTVVTLLGNEELAALGAESLGARLQQAGLRWLQVPIVDFGIPGAAAQQAWRTLLPDLVARLQADERVLVHCAAGYGRTGTMVATILKALGSDSEAAIAQVRLARPGTVETAGQRAFVNEFK
jgi:protein-tyrosine phosphatase